MHRLLFALSDNPETETKLDANLAGIDNLNNFTGYTYDEVLEFYFAQNRFYNPETRRFTQEDPIKDGENWYAYCGNNPLNRIDPEGTKSLVLQWGSKTLPLVAADGPFPVGDTIYVVGLGVCVVVDGASILYNFAKSWDTPSNIRQAKKVDAKVFDYSTLPDYTTGNTATAGSSYAAAQQGSSYGKTYACEREKDATVAAEPRKQMIFPLNPNLFLPRGLVKIIRHGTKNGKIITWELSKHVIFRWDEELVRAAPHYHILSTECMGAHYYAGQPVPEPYNTQYF